ncbi:DUF916 domain-containing protein [Cellulomonas sp. NPDC089187]|uniref:WxL protein peptidoglycan domain-containing protein n=1 Tax=Cellulomonas sp. NPDC089187 TaxID=3154970 RepID=UPI0034210771
MLRALILLLTLALAGLFAFAPRAHAADDTQVSWGVRPANTVHGTDRPNFAYRLPPGGTLTDAIVVTNRGAEPLTLDVYAADGFLTADGTLDLLPAGEESQAVGAWTTAASSPVAVPAGESVEVPFTLTVPADAQPGDYAGGVVSTLRVDNAEGVTVDRRLGSRLHLRVTGDLAPALTVDDVQVSYLSAGANPLAPGTATVSFAVTNTGNARIAPGETVSVGGPFGWGSTSAAELELPELIPGATVQRTATLEEVWPLLLASAQISVGGEVVALPGATAEDVVVPTASASASAWAIPWTWLAALLLIVAVIVWRSGVGRRRKAAQQRAVDAAVAAALSSGTPPTGTIPPRTA